MVGTQAHDTLTMCVWCKTAPATKVWRLYYRRKLSAQRPVCEPCWRRGFPPPKALPACSNCGEPQAWGRPCENCEGHRAAHELLYGHEECKGCQRVLVQSDEQESNWCRQCAGVEDQRDEEGDES